MTSRRVIFLNKGAAPAAAPVASVSPGVPILLVKSVTRAPVPLEPVPETDHSIDFDWAKPMTGHMQDLLCKGLHDARVSVSDVVRANRAFMCGRPLPDDLIELVVALA